MLNWLVKFLSVIPWMALVPLIWLSLHLHVIFAAQLQNVEMTYSPRQGYFSNILKFFRNLNFSKISKNFCYVKLFCPAQATEFGDHTQRVIDFLSEAEHHLRSQGPLADDEPGLLTQIRDHQVGYHGMDFEVL